MNSDQRWKIKRALDDFVNELVNVFPEENREEIERGLPDYPKNSLGTDGGCWTDSELTEYMKACFVHCQRLLKRIASPPESLASEPGTSLVAAGWKCVGEAGGGSWSRKDRPRVEEQNTQRKLRFEVHDAAG